MTRRHGWMGGAPSETWREGMGKDGMCGDGKVNEGMI